MSRVWVYIRHSTLELARIALQRLVPGEYWMGRRRQGEAMAEAADDLRRAERLAATGVTREEIEHAAAKRDEKQGGP